MSEKYTDVELSEDNNINQIKGKFIYQNIQYSQNNVLKGNLVYPNKKLSLELYWQTNNICFIMELMIFTINIFLL